MLRTTTISALTFAPISVVALLLACSGSSGEKPAVRSGAALHRAADCRDLLTQIQDDAIAKVDNQIAAFRKYGSNHGRGLDPANGGVGMGTGGLSGAPVAGDGNGAPGSDNGGGGKGPGSYSETNTQVKGVDEADILKTDGERLYLLHGRELFLLDVWPADETHVTGSAPVEGAPYELFVHEGKATVFSVVYTDVEKHLEGEAGGAAADCYDYCYGYGTEFTKVSVYDVRGEAPVLERELLFEGRYVSARRHDDVVRTVMEGGFKAPGLYYVDVPTYDAFGNAYSSEQIEAELEVWRARMVRDIRATTLDDWIPRRYEKSEDGWEALPQQCDSYYIPSPGLVQDGVTQVVTFDLTAPSAPEVVSVLGGAQHVYANHGVLVVAQPDYRWDFGIGESTQTALHQFDIDGANTAYRASGFIPGYIHNQFSIDERDGVLRISTTEHVRTDPANNPWDWDMVNRVLTVTAEEGELRVLGKTPKMAPGEQVYSTRFIGTRGYVVTFRQIDPLFVVDLSDPAKPEVLGELELPGFSDYMHPLDANHLLTIGRAGTEEGAVLGVALRIFDVSKPTEPTLAHVHEYEDADYSEASHNHKAFTFVADRNLLLFPTVSYQDGYQTKLQVVRVSIESGFAQLGSIEHPCETADDYGCYEWGGSAMRRGVVIDDFVYAVSQSAVSAHPLEDLETELARVDLPAPNYGGATGGSAGVDPRPASGGAGGAPGD